MGKKSKKTTNQKQVLHPKNPGDPEFFEDKKMFSDMTDLLRDHGFDPATFLGGLIQDLSLQPTSPDDFLDDDDMLSDEEQELARELEDLLLSSKNKKGEIYVLKGFLEEFDPKYEKDYAVDIAIDICKQESRHPQACLETILEYARGYMQKPEYQPENWTVDRTHPTATALDELLGFLRLAEKPRLYEKYRKEMNLLDPHFRLLAPTESIIFYMNQRAYAKAQELFLDHWAVWYANNMDAYYNRALLTYLVDGATDRAATYLKEAYAYSPYVATMLVRNTDPNEKAPIDFFSKNFDLDMNEFDEDYDKKEDARFYLENHLPFWREKPGTVAWVRETLGITPQDPRQQQAFQQQLCKQHFSHAEDWPQREDADVFVDVIKNKLGEWLVAVIAVDRDGEPLWQRVEQYDYKPKPKETMAELMEFMSQWTDQDGYAGMRPAQVVVSQKPLVTAWKKQLDKLGISCVMANQEQLSLFAKFEAFFRKVDDYEKTKAKGVSYDDLRSLEVVPETCWEVLTQKMPTWVEDNGKFQRPWNMVAIDVATELVIGNDTSLGEITPEKQTQALLALILSPLVMESPTLPGEIQVRDSKWYQALKKPFGELGVEIKLVDDLPLATKFLDGIAEMMAKDNDDVPMLLSVPGITEPYFDDFYQAADLYYRTKPWQYLDDFHPVRIECQSDLSGKKETHYGVVMGNGGLTFGFAFHFDREDLMNLLKGNWQNNRPPQPGESMSVLYSENFEVPIAEVDMIEEKNYPIEGPEAYPLFLRVRPGGAIQVPLLHEMEKMTACLNGISKLVEQRLKPTTVAVNLTSGKYILSLTVEPVKR